MSWNHEENAFCVQATEPDTPPVYCHFIYDLGYYLMYIWKGENVVITVCKWEDVK